MASKNTRHLLKLEPQSIPLLALPFVPFTERKRLPRLMAIYFVLNAKGTVLYVGQSINLALRWAAHHRAPKLIEYQATRIAWLVMDDQALLDTVEQACIAYFDPLCNGFKGTRQRRYGRIHPSRFIGLERLPRRGDYVKKLVRIPTALYLQLEEQAFRHGRTVNAHMLYILREVMEREPMPPRLPYRARRASTASF